MRTSRITTTAGGLLATLVVVGGLALTSQTSNAGETGAAAATAPVSRTVTLITGDRVRLTPVDGGQTIVALDTPAASGPARGAPAHARTMSVEGHTYVVPEAAMPYVGRQLDLALFDVTQPPENVEVDWAPGAKPRALPGLSLRPVSSGTSAGRISAPSRLGSALAETGTNPDAAPLSGVRSIRPAGRPAGQPATGGAAPETDADGAGALTGPAQPAAPAQHAVPAVPAQKVVRAGKAVPAEQAVQAVPAVPAVPVVPAVPAVPAQKAVPAVQAVPAVPVRPAVPAEKAVPAGNATAGQPAAAENTPPVGPAYPQATLIVKGIDALGAPARSGGVSVSNAEDVLRFGSMRSFADGEVAFSVPIGTYSLSVDMATWKTDPTTGGSVYVSDAVLVMPQVQVTGPQTVITADARTATVLVPVPSTPRSAYGDQVQLTYGRTSAAGGRTTTTYLMMGGAPRVYVKPTEPVTVGKLHFYTYFHLSSPQGTNPAYTYDLHVPADGVVPDTFPSSVSEDSLARIDAAYHAEVAKQTINLHRASIVDWELMPFRATSSGVAPMRRTEYVSALPGVGWVGVVYWRPEANIGYLQGPVAVLTPGQRLTDDALGAPLAPGAAPLTEGVRACVACRQGDTLSLQLYPWTDAGGHSLTGLSPVTGLQVGAEARLYVDGALHTMPSLPTGSTTVPAGDSEFRLELDTVKSADWTKTAARTSTVWTWRSVNRTGSLPAQLKCSDNTRDCAAEPLLLVDYRTQIGLDNAVPAGVATPIDLDVLQQDGTATGVTDVTLDISGDDGATWRSASLRARGAGRFTASVLPPVGGGFLSFRVHATDGRGSVAQTILRAIRVAAG